MKKVEYELNMHIENQGVHICAIPTEPPKCSYCHYIRTTNKNGEEYKIEIIGVSSAEVGEILDKINKDVSEIKMSKKNIWGKAVSFIFQEGITPTIVRVVASIVVAYLLFLLKLN